MTMSLAQDAEAFIVRRPMVWEVIIDVAAHFDLTVEALRGPSRKQALAYPRQVAMYLAHEHCGKSYPQLAREFDRDHSTVIHAVQKIGALVDADAHIARDMERILAAIYRRQRSMPKAGDEAPTGGVVA